MTGPLFNSCVEIAKQDGINTFHHKMVCDDGSYCEYEFLNDDGTIFAVELERDRDAAVETFAITVKRNIPDDAGDRTNEWWIESVSTMRAVS
jgi:hypothetical protein